MAGLGTWRQREDRLDRVTRLARTIFGTTWTGVTVVEQDKAWFPSVQGFEPRVLPRRQTFCDHIVRRGGTLVVPDATADPQFAQLPVVTDQGIRFYAGVPLHDAAGQVVGSLCLYDTAPRELDADQRETLEDLAAWAEQELQSSAELVRAAEVQTSMLPSGPLPVEGWDVHGICLPSLAVGGDLFDYATSHGVLHVGLGDVMGKGTGAALLGAGVRTALRRTHEAVVAGVDLGITVTQVARGLTPDLQRAESFVTLFEAAVDLDDGFLRYVDAGMGLCLVVRADGELERLSSDDLPLGVLADAHWTEQDTTLEPGDRLLLFSDGLLDLVDDEVRWWEPVGRLVREHDDAGALLATIARLTAAGSPTDDVTVVAVFREAP